MDRWKDPDGPLEDPVAVDYDGMDAVTVKGLMGHRTSPQRSDTCITYQNTPGAPCGKRNSGNLLV